MSFLIFHMLMLSSAFLLAASSSAMAGLSLSLLPCSFRLFLGMGYRCFLKALRNPLATARDRSGPLGIARDRSVGLSKSFAKCFSTFGRRGRERNCAKIGLKGGWIAARTLSSERLSEFGAP